MIVVSNAKPHVFSLFIFSSNNCTHFGSLDMRQWILSRTSAMLYLMVAMLYTVQQEWGPGGQWGVDVLGTGICTKLHCKLVVHLVT